MKTETQEQVRKGAEGALPIRELNDRIIRFETCGLA